MSDIAVYSIGVVATLLASIGVVLYMRPHLLKILIDLCGTLDRAKFWLVFSNVALIIIPLIGAMSFSPNSNRYESIFFELSDQIKLGLLGLIATVIVIGFTMSRFIPPIRPTPPAKSNSQPQI